MDNISHSLVGWLLAETGLKRRTRKGLAACVLAANMPDIDVFFGWAPWEPLATHRGFTHGLVGGVLLLPPVLAGLLWLLDRWQLRHWQRFASGLPMRFGWLVVLCYLGAITHPLLDLQNTYAVQLFSPASSGWYHTDGLFIVSAWLLVIAGAGIWRARRAGRGRPAVLALAGLVAFVALNIGISALAWRAPERDAPYAKPDRVFASPAALLFWQRDVVWRQSGMIHFGKYDPLRNVFGLVELGERLPDRMDDPLVRRAALATAEVRTFLAWSQMPIASVSRQGCAATVTFGDARYSKLPVSGSFNVAATVAAGGPGC